MLGPVWYGEGCWCQRSGGWKDCGRGVCELGRSLVVAGSVGEEEYQESVEILEDRGDVVLQHWTLDQTHCFEKVKQLVEYRVLQLSDTTQKSK